MKNISVLTELRLKANQSTKENRFPLELSAMPPISPKTNSPNTRLALPNLPLLDLADLAWLLLLPVGH